MIRRTVRFSSVKYSHIRYINILSNRFNSCNSSSNLATQTHQLIKYLNSKVAIFGTTVPNLKYILFPHMLLVLKRTALMTLKF